MDNIDQNIMDKSMRSVFVGNIPYEATEEKLKDIFSEVGQVLSFKLVFDRETGKPKGYGFCEYRDQETALSAMRNLNSYEISGRSLRVDNACTEKSRMEMQNLMQQPTVENPYGDPINADKAPEAISKAVASLPPEQMFELMKQMKLCIQNNPPEARTMLLQNPQLAYALLQAQVVMRIVDPVTACGMLYKANQPPPVLTPSDKPTSVGISSSIPLNIVPVPVALPVSQPQQSVPASNRNDFQPPPQTVPAVFSSGQDVDLRSMDSRPIDSRSIDPRLARGISDQDMRTTISSALSNDAFIRDPRAGLNSFTADPRQRQIDPRQLKTIGGVTIPITQQRSNVAAQVASMPRVGAGMSPNIGASGASDQEKAALIMQVLQLSDEQIAMLPSEQRTSILVLKEQIAKSTQR